MGEFSRISSLVVQNGLALVYDCLHNHTKATAVGEHVLAAVFLPHGLADLSVTVSIGTTSSGYMQVLIAGAVLAGGYIVYSMIQQDPDAKRALRDAKGKLRLLNRSGSGWFAAVGSNQAGCCAGEMKGAWNDVKGKANESYGETKGRAKEATN